MFIFVFNGYNGHLGFFQGTEDEVADFAEEYTNREIEEGHPGVIYFFGEIEQY